MFIVEISGSYSVSDGEKVVHRRFFSNKKEKLEDSSTALYHKAHPNLSLLRQQRNKKVKTAFDEMKKKLSTHGIKVTVE